MGEINYLVQLGSWNILDLWSVKAKSPKKALKFDFEGHFEPLKLLRSGWNNFFQIPQHLLHISGVYKFSPLLYKIGRNKLSSPDWIADMVQLLYSYTVKQSFFLFSSSQKSIKIWSKFNFEGYSGPLKLLRSGWNNFFQIPQHLLPNLGVNRFSPLLYKIGRNKLFCVAG